MLAQRIFHCTFYKCGSQWVRDVLAHPSVLEHTGFRLTETGRDVQSAGWPTLGAQEMASPLYSAGIGDWYWRKDKQPGDRCVVVVRDPRDIVVSLVMSLSLSHTPSAVTGLLRTPIRNAAPADRIRIGIHLFAQWAKQFRNWFQRKYQDGELVMDYAELVGDERASFDRIFDHLEWDLPEWVRREAVSAHSFATTSGGRQTGEENEFSHRRKGIAGDWRNHFTRELGEAFENAGPGLLTECGYAESGTWWETLPEALPERVDGAAGERLRMLRTMEEQEKALDIVRTAAQDRLRDLLALYRQAAEERLSVTRELSLRAR